MTDGPHPEPAWLTARIDQRLAVIREGLTAAIRETDPQIVMAYLDEPDDGATARERERWERSCDKCGRYCPDEFYTGHTSRILDGRQVLIAFGICPECKGSSN